MQKVTVREESVVIPTYEIADYDKNPMFLEKRVYQGSSGRVYPHPVCEGVSDTKTNHTYQAVYLENDYLLVMILPELGGRIQRLLDKTTGYDAVYYNEVIKPALVGLAGPWISGGIEFNWPQHHRPSTFDPVSCTIEKREDGAVTVWVGETEHMFHTRGTAGYTLYPDRAYLEISGRVYNPTDRPQTFLWWANPAVPVNDYTQSIFPPDVTAVMDHGKRDVSRFPIADGVYYKVDYAPGTDISRYKNIPVPTSYMAAHSDYDFIGNYDHNLQTGLLHIADHHISPGKKQWTWGNGDFGRAWDRNLTDENGPYIELMTGVFTDNQPDFTYLKPYEEKTFTQYFMPYQKVGAVKNASTQIVAGLEIRPVKDTKPIPAEENIRETQADQTTPGTNTGAGQTPREAVITLYAPAPLEDFILTLARQPRQKKTKPDCPRKTTLRFPYSPDISESDPTVEAMDPLEEISATYLSHQIAVMELQEKDTTPEPVILFTGARSMEAGTWVRKTVPLPEDCPETELVLTISQGRQCLLTYQPQEREHDLPSPAEPIPAPEKLPTTEKLFLAATHLEQYRHATRSPEPYYLEGLKRDPSDIRLNNGYGRYLYNKGLFWESIPYFEAAIAAATWKNPNPYDCEPFFNLGLALRRTGQDEAAYDMFYKAVWDAYWQGPAFYQLACIACERREYLQALAFTENALSRGSRNVKARFLKTYLLRCMRRTEEAGAFVTESLSLDPLDVAAHYEAFLLDLVDAKGFQALLGGDLRNYIELALYYLEAGQKKEADRLLATAESLLMKAEEKLPFAPMYYFYRYYCTEDPDQLTLGEFADPDYCFPNRLEDIQILTHAIDGGGYYAAYYLGNLLYDKGRYDHAIQCWETCAPYIAIPTVFRNLALAYYNKANRPEDALDQMELAFAMDDTDARVFYELDQLHKILGTSPEQRLEQLEEHQELLPVRDDLYTEYITLLNLCGRHKEAYQRILNHNFHPWEGGEGKIPAQYRLSLTLLAKEEPDDEKARVLLTQALTYPHNLGEGKLIGALDNDLYFLRALRTSDPEARRKDLTLAARGEFALTAASYYNDQPPEMMYYAALALRELGDTKEADRRFDAMTDYGLAHRTDHVEIDYFAVSLPDFLIFEGDPDKKFHTHCYFMSYLGSLGKDDKKAADYFAGKLRELEPAHLGLLVK